MNYKDYISEGYFIGSSYRKRTQTCSPAKVKACRNALAQRSAQYSKLRASKATDGQS